MVVGGRELIDTLWNVNNTTNVTNNSPCGRINRYIMECKSDLFKKIQINAGELIDTLWNVNNEGDIVSGSCSKN